MGDLRRWHQKLLEAGERADAKNFMNCVEETLLPYDDTTLVSDIINIMELHLLLGIVLALIDYLKDRLGEKKVDETLVANNISYSWSNGRKTLNGNACHKIISKAEAFMEVAILLPDSTTTNEVIMAVECLGLFEEVVHTCFGVEVQGDYKQAIEEFCPSYRALPRITLSPKFHTVEGHIVRYLERRHNMVRLLFSLFGSDWSSGTHFVRLSVRVTQVFLEQ